MTDSKSPLELEVAALIVQALNLEITPQEIDPAEPLYHEGLGLDSIDMLELSLAISKAYGFQLKSDAPDNASIFSSLQSLTRHIEKSRVK